MKPVTVVTAQSVGSAQPKHAFPVLMQAIDLIGATAPTTETVSLKSYPKGRRKPKPQTMKIKGKKPILLFHGAQSLFRLPKIIKYMSTCHISAFTFPFKFSAPNDFSISAERFFNLRQTIFKCEEHVFPSSGNTKKHSSCPTKNPHINGETGLSAVLTARNDFCHSLNDNSPEPELD